MSMRTKIALYTILSAVAALAASAFVLFLFPSWGMISILIASLAGIVTAVIFSLQSGKKAVDREIDELLDVRSMARSVAEGNGASYQEPNDYEIAHPVKFIYKELKIIDDRLRLLTGELKKHERLFDSIQEGVIIADSEGRVMTLNPSAKKIFSTPELRGDMTLEHIIFDTATLSELEEVSSGRKDSGEANIRFKGGNTYNVKVYRVDLKGENDGIILFARNITPILAAEKVRRDFVANVSHELKTPLTSIRGFSEMLKGGTINEEETRNQYLSLIIAESDRLSSLINDVLKLSELENIALDEGKSRVNLEDHVKKAVELVAPQAKAHGVTLHYATESSYLFANPVRMDELLINLIDNAIKYNRKNGRVDITVSHLNNEIVLLVADTGIGIPKADQPRIFERFYRVDKSRSRESGGTGLGLAIVKHIVGLYKGKITLQSEEGEGTSIEIRFPAAPAEA